MSNIKSCSVCCPKALESDTARNARIEIIKQLINSKLSAFANDSGNHPSLQEYIKAAHHILLSPDAKRIRSILPVLIANARNFDEETCFKYGITIELLHYSSLIHDDVIDADQIRRGFPTLNGTFTNSHAVLIGDFMMCSVIDFALGFNHSNEVIKLMVGSIKNLVTGLVIEQRVMPQEPTLERYLEMADLKTGSLFKLSIGLPFIADQRLPEAMKCGQIFGLLFQIYDDYLDRNKDVQYQNIFHIISEKEIIDIWNKYFSIFIELAKVLEIEQVIMEMIYYLRSYGHFLEVPTSEGILFET
ncbi:MAG: polyprenyl synthetase family protein [Proteobacteria bacterium]|nr:polyprenyl synthetase family protein [Pseudomonadota bacterium]MBU1715665.1 polyprenyl synthetase family protein [Pseudomonadota bacterium]